MTITITSAELTEILQNLYEWQHGPLSAESLALIAGSTSYGQVQRAFADKTVPDGLPTDVTQETMIFRPDTNVELLYAYYTSLVLNTPGNDFNYARFYIYDRDPFLNTITTLAAYDTNVASGGIIQTHPWLIPMGGLPPVIVEAGHVITFEIAKNGLGVGVGVGKLELYYRQV